MVDSLIRKTRAMSAAGTAQIVRSVSATRASMVSAGWQHVKMSRSRSSTMSSSASGAAPAFPAVNASTARSRILRRSTDARRKVSIARLRATVMSQPPGLSGTPSAGQRRKASARASWAQSSASVQSPVTRIRAATMRE